MIPKFLIMSETAKLILILTLVQIIFLPKKAILVKQNHEEIFKLLSKGAIEHSSTEKTEQSGFKLYIMASRPRSFRG